MPFVDGSCTATSRDDGGPRRCARGSGGGSRGARPAGGGSGNPSPGRGLGREGRGATDGTGPWVPRTARRAGLCRPAGSGALGAGAQPEGGGPTPPAGDRQ